MAASGEASGESRGVAFLAGRLLRALVCLRAFFWVLPLKHQISFLGRFIFKKDKNM